MSDFAEMTVKAIQVQVQADRVLLGGDDPDYWIIANLTEGLAVGIGDRIIYEPYGLNFGWFKECSSEKAN